MKNPCRSCKRYPFCNLDIKDSPKLTHCDLRIPPNVPWKNRPKREREVNE